MLLLQIELSLMGYAVCSALILLLEIFAFLYIYKASHVIKTGLSVLIIFCFIAIGIVQYAAHLKYLNNLTSTVLLLCAGLLLLYFLFIIFQIYRISRVVEKTEENVIHRKALVDRLGYILTFATSFFVVGIAYTSLIDPRSITSVWVWVVDVSRFAFFTTMALVLLDGIISKICSPVYTADQVQFLDKFNLYLRSFDADHVRKKDEEIICRTFNHLFPTYAIGDPNALLQPYGADRIYATDDEWQETVSSLMSKSQIIIIRCGLTNGTIWEMDKILSSSYVNKCVFVIDNIAALALLTSKISNSGIDVEIPDMNLNQSQYGVYIYKNIQNKWSILAKIIKKESDVESLINDILRLNSDVDEEYSKVLKIRHNSLRKIFSDDVPDSIQQSLNWGIISPIINMRHWPLTYWVIFLGLMFAGAALLKSITPVYFILLIPFLIGNRIEWTQIPCSSPDMFLKRQRREASIMWTSMLSSLIIAWICILFTV